MKIIVDKYDYGFSAANKTVTFADNYLGLQLNEILLITNITNNTIIYQFNSSTLGGTLAGNVLTLTYNTASMSDYDQLQIVVDTEIIQRNAPKSRVESLLEDLIDIQKKIYEHIIVKF